MTDRSVRMAAAVVLAAGLALATRNPAFAAAHGYSKWDDVDVDVNVAHITEG